MAHIIIDNPAGCWKNSKPESCKACYYSQVKDGQWRGSEKCWNSQCLKYGGNE